MLKKIMLLMFISIGISSAVKAQDIQISDLVGKWKLAKIEEVQIRGTNEIIRKSFMPEDYGGQIFFDEFECSSDYLVSFGENYYENLGSNGNIQLYPESPEIAFHGADYSVYFTLSREENMISLKRIEGANQQSQIQKVVYYYFER